MIGAVREVIEEAQWVDFGCHKAKPIVVLVTLDVKNMFNLVRWIDILRTLREEFKVHTRHSVLHFSDRRRTDETSQRQKAGNVTAGVAQGSVLRST